MGIATSHLLVLSRSMRLRGCIKSPLPPPGKSGLNDNIFFLPSNTGLSGKISRLLDFNDPGCKRFTCDMHIRSHKQEGELMGLIRHCKMAPGILSLKSILLLH